jgi:hypothetical protein
MLIAGFTARDGAHELALGYEAQGDQSRLIN